MATTQGKELWRTRVERLLATDMSVSEWCAVNKVSESATYRRLGLFADTEPELFGGAQNIADRDRNAWLVRTRENMRGLSAPIVPAGGSVPADGGFEIELADLEHVRSIPSCRDEAIIAHPPRGESTPIFENIIFGLWLSAVRGIAIGGAWNGHRLCASYAAPTP